MMESMGPNQVNTLLGLTMNHNSMSEAIASMNQRNSKIGSSSSLKTSVVLSEDQNLLKQSKTSGFAQLNDSPPINEADEDIHNLKDESEKSISIRNGTQEELKLDQPIPDSILQGTVSPVEIRKTTFSEVEVNSPIGSYQVQEQMLSMSENVMSAPELDLPSDLIQSFQKSIESQLDFTEA